MIHALDYARPSAGRIRWLAISAHAASAWPLFLLAALYGQWLLSWYMLGHPPRPSFDDPKAIAGASWMHTVTGLALMGFLPALPAALVLNLWHAALKRLNVGHMVARMALAGAVWLGAFALLRWDPGQVVYWWFD